MDCIEYKPITVVGMAMVIESLRWWEMEIMVIMMTYNKNNNRKVFKESGQKV